MHNSVEFLISADGVSTCLDDEHPQHCLALSWDQGNLAAAFYSIDTMELFVTQETIDLKPSFHFVNNLFRQITPKAVIASGSNLFLKEVMRLMNFSASEEPQKYRLNRNKSVTTSSFVVFTNDAKSLGTCRNRIMSLKLPGIPRNATELEVQMFIEGVLPLHRGLIVYSLGNLLNFLDSNWRHLYLRDENNPVITDLKVFHLQSLVLIDDTTFSALQVFNGNESHPSGFKCGAAGTSREGLSLFSLLNKCCSRNGTNTMRMLLQQPIRDVCELHLRFETIKWCVNPRNAQSLVKIQRNLRRINNVSILFARLSFSLDDVHLWKQFRDTIFYALATCQLCLELNQTVSIICELANFCKDSSTLKDILSFIDEIVDIPGGLQMKRFVMKRGLDVELDALKDQMNSIQAQLEVTATAEVGNLNISDSQVFVHYIPEIGFLVSITAASSEEAALHPIQDSLLQFVFSAGYSFYYKTKMCIDLNAQYGNLHPEIIAKEKQTAERLLQHLQESLADIQTVVKLCGKFDCMMAMASVATRYKFVKPQITTEKLLRITKGRHILFETRGKFIPNDADISEDNKNIVTILNAPNASGKSVYLKQIGLIAFMAHVGCYVPAELAQIPLLDSMYSRIYSPEATYQATSSFVADLQQMSRVMMSSTNRSLILIDEFGKGTNVEEGRALLISCLDSLLGRGDATPIIIVSTHDPDIHDKLEHKDRAALHTFQMESTENGQLIPLYKIIVGKCDPNYATTVPQLKHFFDQLMNETFRVGNKELNITENLNTTLDVSDIHVNVAFMIIKEYLKNENFVGATEVNNILNSIKFQ